MPPRLPFHPELLVLLLAFLCSLLPLLASAQSISSALAVDYTLRNAHFHKSTSRWLCQPVHIRVVGLFPPFALDAVEYPVEDYTSTEGQKVLASVATNVSATPGSGEAVVLWQPTGKKGAKVVVRAMDAQGNAAYTVMRRVKDGNKENCTDLDPHWIDDNAETLAIILVVVVWVLILLLYLCVPSREAAAARQRERAGGAAGDVPLVQRA
ncbi:hypothetical protein JCM6882_006135 [Rhodosporidiobolus microsporus]